MNNNVKSGNTNTKVNSFQYYFLYVIFFQIQFNNLTYCENNFYFTTFNTTLKQIFELVALDYYVGSLLDDDHSDQHFHTAINTKTLSIYMYIQCLEYSYYNSQICTAGSVQQMPHLDHVVTILSLNQTENLFCKGKK